MPASKTCLPKSVSVIERVTISFSLIKSLRVFNTFITSSLISVAGTSSELDKVEISTSASVYVPAGLAHFPLFWRNVKRPVMFVVVICNGFMREDYIKTIVRVPLEGRPT